MKPENELRPGEAELIKHFENRPEFNRLRTEAMTEIDARQKTKEGVDDILNELKKEIGALPEIKKEAETHHEPLPDLINTLSLAVELAIHENIKKGLNLILSTRDPFMIDQFHDLLAGHFFQTLVNNNKIRLIG